MVAVDNIAVIQATLAPIFLVTGAGIFVNAMQQRLFRVSDRMTAPAGKDGSRVRPKDHVRLILLRNAVLLGMLVIALTVVTTVLLLVPSAFPGTSVRAWPIWTMGAGLLAFSGALAAAVTDAWLAVRSVERRAAENRAEEAEARATADARE